MGVKGGAPPLQVEGSALVAVGEILRAKHGYSARWRAVTSRGARKTPKKR